MSNEQLLKQLDKWIEPYEKTVEESTVEGLDITRIICQTYVQAYWNVKQFILVNTPEKKQE
jgi:hypothetical protein